MGLSTWANGGNGSFAIGTASTANGLGAVQFSTGINTLGTSLQIGSGIRIVGDTSLSGGATPSGVKNGDMWVNSGGTVLIYSKSAVAAIG